MFAPTGSLLCIIVLFDTSIPGITKRLTREHAGWSDFAEMERLSANCTALLIRPGAAKRLLQ